MKEKKDNGISRRAFLGLTAGTGAGLMLKPQQKLVEKLIPYINAPVYPKPGEWAHYLSTCRECPAGCGMMLWHRDGRVTKAEGNPLHPINKGKLCIRGQSAVLGQYDNDRLTKVLKKDDEGHFAETSWDDALAAIKKELTASADVQLISNLQTGSLAGVMQDFAGRYNRKPLFYEAFSYDSMRKANQEMYGKPLIPTYDLSGRDLIVSIGVDFLETWLSPVEHARQFADFHTLKDKKLGKCIYFGPTESLTALNSDEFIITEPGTEAQTIAGLINRLSKIRNLNLNDELTAFLSRVPEQTNPQLDDLALEISRAKNPLILAGRPEDKSEAGKITVKAANVLNEVLGNNVSDSLSESHALSRSALSDEAEHFFATINPGTVLIIHNTNPIYTNPKWETFINKAVRVIYIGTMLNETARLAHWVLPMNYSLEEWGDYEAREGTLSLLQPAMKPLFDTRSAGDILLALGGPHSSTGYNEIVRSNWRKWAAAGNTSSSQTEEEENPDGQNPNEFYKNLLSQGYLTTEAHPTEETTTRLTDMELLKTIQHFNNNEFYLHVPPSLFFYDGSLSNRGWLQEIPHPVSNIVWQSWVDMNQERAGEMKIREGDVIKLSSGGVSMEAAVRLTQNIEKHTLTVEAGQGHTSLGKIADEVGINALALIQTNDRRLPMVKIEKTGERRSLLYLNATKDQHHRELLQHEKLDRLVAGTAETEEMNWPLPEGYKPETDLYKGHEHKGHRWGMVIDLQKCIGCKACEAACYAENNIPVVGKKNCREGREMSWMKVVPYYLEEGQTAWLPTPCQHCDSAPCEPVCPVYAAVHSEEGLNSQIYNRCIGTRYCSNNCPYKVRRFNWLNVKHEYPMNLQLNPEVTVRERGVMEKCTFCVQRIRNKQYQARIENRELTDGEITPACAQTCPTGAITFGDLMDKNSQVRKLIAEHPRRYQLLNELNTKTAVVYLKKITL